MGAMSIRDFPPELQRLLKSEAAKEGKTLKEFVTEVLYREIEKREKEVR